MTTHFLVQPRIDGSGGVLVGDGAPSGGYGGPAGSTMVYLRNDASSASAALYITVNGGTTWVASQALDAELTALGGLTSAADGLPYFTGLGTAALATFTAFARTLLAEVDAAGVRAALGLDTGDTAAFVNVNIAGDVNTTNVNCTGTIFITKESATPGASTAAAGAASGDAGVLPAATANVYPTTAADDTKGVRVHAGDQVTGRRLFIGNGVSNKILNVYAPTGGSINGGAGDAAVPSVSGRGVIMYCLDADANTWLAW